MSKKKNETKEDHNERESKPGKHVYYPESNEPIWCICGCEYFETPEPNRFICVRCGDEYSIKKDATGSRVASKAVDSFMARVANGEIIPESWLH